MHSNKKTIKGGLYLVVDPAQGWERVAPVVQKAIAGGTDLIQVWDHWLPGQSPAIFIQALCRLAHAAGLPVLLNGNWSLLRETPADGIHLDNIPADINAIRQQIGRPFCCGITCGNDLATVQWAIDHQLDYISFCSLFPSATAQSCELVTMETVRAARQMTGMPVFLAGGITLDNIHHLSLAAQDGIAVISGIMHAADPEQKTKQYKEAIQQLKQPTI